MDLECKKEAILEAEACFANAMGAAVIEKPRVNFWMVLIPVLFLHFIYRMKKYREGRAKFDTDFMVSRKLAMDAALAAVSSGNPPDILDIAKNAGVSDKIKKPYIIWMGVLVDHYMDLMRAHGGGFASLVRFAYGNRENYLLTLNRLERVEREFYNAIKPHLSATAGAEEIITAIETQSRIFRRDLAQEIFS